MKITKRQLRRIIKEEVAAMRGQEAQEGQEDLESKSRILKGLEMAGIDPMKLKDLPSNTNQLRALLDMINQAIETTVAGKAVAAQRQTSKITQRMS